MLDDPGLVDPGLVGPGLVDPGLVDIVSQIMDPVPPPAWRTLTVLTGPAGIGRTHALDRIRDAARAAGLTTVGLRLSPAERTVRLHLASRLAGELSALAREPVRGCAKLWDHPTPDGVRRALVQQIMAALAGARSARRGLVLLIDDLQWIDQPSLAVLAPMVRDLVGSTASIVCTLRTPLPDDLFAACRTLPDELVGDGIAAVRPLRPMSAGQADAFVAGLVKARPHRAFSGHLAWLCRGRPGALHVAVEGYRLAGSLRIVDHRCDLTDPGRRRQAPELAGVPGAFRLLDAVRELPAPVVVVAAAIAVLYPFGKAVVGLLETELGLDPAMVATALDALVRAGVLGEDRAHGGWRFAVPLVAHALRWDLGPYERSRLAQAAVGAAWSNGSRPADPTFLADELVQASGLVDPERASAELLGYGTGAILNDARSAARWLAGAAEGTSDRTRRRYALFGHVVASGLDGDHPVTVRAARLLAAEYAGQLSADEQRELRLTYLVGLSGTGDTAELSRVAAGAVPLPGGGAAAPAVQALALCLLNHWQVAEALLTQAEPSMPSTVEGACVRLIRCCAAALLGRPAGLLDTVSGPGGLACPCRHHIRALVRTLILLGDAGRVEWVLADRGLPVTALPLADRSLLAWRRGRWDDALDYGLANIEAQRLDGYPPGNAAVHHAVASILVSRARPGRARALLRAARGPGDAMSHLIDAAGARIDQILGAPAEAERKVSAGLASAHRSGVVTGTGELWLLGTELAIQRGDREEALRRLPQIAALAGADHTAALYHQLVRVQAAGDDAAAGEAVRLARTLGQPYPLARTLETVALAGGQPALLSEAFDLYGELNAILDRRRVHTLMRERDMALPDRHATAAEYERIVATLVADGLSNREIATVLGSSEKSVEGRLTRLFTRTGYRSRVELTTAVLAGDYSVRTML